MAFLLRLGVAMRFFLAFVVAFSLRFLYTRFT
jgi:hypothetical protein